MSERTPQDFGGPAFEEEALFYDSYGILPNNSGGMLYSNGNFYLKDAYGVFNPRSGSGLTEIEHEKLDTLTHEIAENSYEEYTYINSDIINVTIWTDINKIKKIREEQYSYLNGHRIDQAITIQYDINGSEKSRITESYNYSANKIISVITVKG